MNDPRISAAMPITKQELNTRLDKVAKSDRQLSTLRECLADSNTIGVYLTKESIIVSVESTGARFFWEIDDPRTAIACLAVAGVYEPLETQILALASREANYVIDVGANVGYYATVLPLLNDSIKKLYAFEPMPRASFQLNSNISLNSLTDKVKTFAMGISNKSATLTFYLPDIFGTSATSSALLHPEVKNTEVQVTTSTLDFLFAEGEILGCDLLKIDVEGAEKFVLEGSAELIETCSPVIFAELLRKWSAVHGYHPTEVLEMLNSYGYSCWGVSANMPRIDKITEETVETNFLFLKSTKETHQNIISKLRLK